MSAHDTLVPNIYVLSLVIFRNIHNSSHNCDLFVTRLQASCRKQLIDHILFYHTEGNRLEKRHNSYMTTQQYTSSGHVCSVQGTVLRER